jgi:predicted GIY-YIG superfamily endonuclease
LKNPHKYLYAIKCEGDKYYIGQTNDLVRRLRQHKEQGKEGAIWTSMHKALDFVETWTIENYSKDDALVFENKMTLLYINKYGWKNVRGGMYVMSDEEEHFRILNKFNNLIDGDFIPYANDLQINRYVEAKKIIDDKKLSRDKSYIAVLKLEAGKFYVGASEKKIENYIRKHFYSKHTKWTTRYKPIGIDNIYELNQDDGYREVVNNVVIQLMAKYGIENVRGGAFRDMDEAKVKIKVHKKYPDFKINKPQINNRILGNTDYINILELLMEGSDPISGEVFDDDHFLFHQDIQKALSKAIDILKGGQVFDIESYALNRIEKLPILKPLEELKPEQKQVRLKHPRAYDKWVVEEDYWLRVLFQEERNLNKLSIYFKRPVSAIRSRLKVIGVIN